MTSDSIHPSEQLIGFSEAIATWTTRYIDPLGYECILSIQAETGSEVLKKAESAIAHLTDSKCIPLRKDSYSGHLDISEKKHEPTVLVKSDAGGPVCPIHSVEMKQYSKNGRSWYAHRYEDYWCHGKKRE